LPSRPRAVACRALRGAGRGLRADAGIPSGVRGGGGGSEAVAAGLVAGQFGGTVADQLVQGVGDRAG